ncbi:hypothetical protein [Rhizobium sp. BR 315]|uniref:hypothetical protein n=1 Tax=Rhizobium sp. BR 315 TaxID=3040014 RepID=UPI003D33EB9F
MAEVQQFKAIKPRSRRSRVEANGRKTVGMLPELRSPTAPQTNADIAMKDPEGEPSIMGFVKQAVVPLIILLCAIAAFSIVVGHMSGQPGYSARGNVSSPTSIE